MKYRLKRLKRTYDRINLHCIVNTPYGICYLIGIYFIKFNDNTYDRVYEVYEKDKCKYDFDNRYIITPNHRFISAVYCS